MKEIILSTYQTLARRNIRNIVEKQTGVRLKF
jgi:hypothetical protein